jgi:hypothetical protein
MARFLKMFGEEGVRLISMDPALDCFLDDPTFWPVIEDISPFLYRRRSDDFWP